ncbi:hypothetical protein [Macrococcoides caseolyticum]|uniref:hypothetical protein n=1 Tax=Macrococcoides caseolyticum TaxID=69966 RepID=UPI001F23A46E|nr:hypothetical protein [Macrococcus caseolyticus]MCE4956060.1 hypothetical protein [Macrococcus caseolyticus]
MNNKLFFYVYLFIIAFLSINIFKHITSGAPAQDYVIYALIALSLLGIISDELIQLFYGKRAPFFLCVLNSAIYLAILILSIYAITISSSWFDIVLYGLFIPAALLLIYVEVLRYKKAKKA